MGWWSSRQTAEAHSKEHSRLYCASSGGYVKWTECPGTIIIRLLSSWYPHKCHRSLRWSGSDSHRVITLDIQSATQFSCSGHCVWFVSIFICLTTMFIRSHLFQIMTSLSEQRRRYLNVRNIGRASAQLRSIYYCIYYNSSPSPLVIELLCCDIGKCM